MSLTRREFLATTGALTAGLALHADEKKLPGKTKNTKFAPNLEMWWPKEKDFLKKLEASAALGYSAQRRLLAATDPDGHRLLHRPGRQRDVLVVEELAREVGVLVGERVTHGVDTFVEQLAARSEIDTERFELGFDVTRADTDDGTSTAEVIEGHELLGRQQRMAIGRDEHCREHSHRARLRGDIGQRRDRIEPLRRHVPRVVVVGNRDVVAHTDEAATRCLDRLGGADHVVHGAAEFPRLTFRLGQRLDRELYSPDQLSFGHDRHERMLGRTAKA